MRPPEPADRDLARRLERTEARAGACLVEARARLSPTTGATWIDVGGTYAMFDGVDSPLTQTFGLGLFDELTDEQLARIEAFFTSRGAPVAHEVSPLAGIPLVQQLVTRGYLPIECSSVLYRPLDVDAARPARSAVTTRVIAAGEHAMWARISAGGWSTEGAELAEFVRAFGEISARAEASYPFLAELDGQAIAAGMLHVADDVALLAGASTVPAARNRGAQAALLEARLRFAAERGCTTAMIVAAPGSRSQRNAEKCGFRIAYTRTKWQRPA